MADEAALTTQQAAELQGLEAAIERGLQTFFEVGSALKRIRDERLLSDSHKTFPEYCVSRWGFSDGHGNKLIKAAEVKENVTPIGVISPANEAQCRPLTKLGPEDQQKAWKTVLDRAGEDGQKHVTAKLVEQVVKECCQSTAPTTAQSESSDDSMNVFVNLVSTALKNMGPENRDQALAWFRETYLEEQDSPAEPAKPAKPFTKPKDYLPRLPDDHEQACKMVTAELNQRCKQLKGFEGWDTNGRADALRRTSRNMSSKSKLVLNNAGVGATSEEPVLFDCTWPEHLDADQVKEVWGEYVERRRKKNLSVSPSVLKQHVRELSQFEEDAVVEILAKAIGAQNGCWAGFGHCSKPDSDWKVTRDKDGRPLSNGNDVSFLDVVSFCDQLHVRQTYVPQVRDRFGDKVAEVVRQLKLANIQRDRMALAPRFKELMEAEGA